MKNLKHARTPRPWVGLALLFVLVASCESPTGGDPSESIIPPRGRRGTGVPTLVPQEFKEVTSTITTTPLLGEPVGLTSAPDGETVRVAGNLGYPACRNDLAGFWTASGGWTALPKAHSDVGYLVDLIGDGGHFVGSREAGCGSLSVFWASDSSADVLLGTLQPSSVNASGQVVGTDGPYPQYLVVATPNGSGGFTWTNVQDEVLSAAGYNHAIDADINDRGQIVAKAYPGNETDDTRTRPVLIDGNVVHELLPEGWVGVADLAINNADPVQVSGTWFGEDHTSGEDDRAFRVTVIAEDSIVVELLSAPEGYPPNTSAKDITDNGDVIGTVGPSMAWGPFWILLWTESGGSPTVTLVGDGCHESSLPHLDNYAHLVGLVRATACGALYEIEID